MVFKEQDFLKSVNGIAFINRNNFSSILVALVVLILVMILGSLAAYSVAGYIFTPLRTLNQKMIELLSDNMQHELVEPQKSSTEMS
jgi:tetratricopeptide (TPR) repeat protein